MSDTPRYFTSSNPTGETLGWRELPVLGERRARHAYRARMLSVIGVALIGLWITVGLIAANAMGLLG